MRKDVATLQYGAVPFVMRDGRPQVMLMTSRGTGRWIIPKGRPEAGVAPAALAAKEAFEEAGVSGAMSAEPIGRFFFMKTLSSGKTRLCEVVTFLLNFEHQFEDWPEKGQREIRWMTPDEASLLASGDGLKEILMGLSDVPVAA
jgi:8-oxo-dGTP pyrophosphatase MutT (NUDIX family)